MYCNIFCVNVDLIGFSSMLYSHQTNSMDKTKNINLSTKEKNKLNAILLFFFSIYIFSYNHT